MSFTVTGGYWIHSLKNEEDGSNNSVSSCLAIRESAITSEKITTYGSVIAFLSIKVRMQCRPL